MEPQTPTPPTPPETPATPPVTPEPTEPQQPIQPEIDSTPPPEGGSEGVKGTLSTILLLVLAPLIAILLTVFVFHSYQVDGPSMQTTLHNGDRLIVWKLPRTWARITRHNYIPQRGDVIIFHHEDGATLEGNKQLIKRVVALPGERVVVKDGTLTVFNKEHPEGFSPDTTMSYGSVITNTPGDVDITVPEGEIFVAGDNRSNSLDSRYFGPIPVSDVVGNLGIRIFPFTDFRIF